MMLYNIPIAITLLFDNASRKMINLYVELLSHPDVVIIGQGSSVLELHFKTSFNTLKALIEHCELKPSDSFRFISPIDSLDVSPLVNIGSLKEVYRKTLAYYDTGYLSAILVANKGDL